MKYFLTILNIIAIISALVAICFVFQAYHAANSFDFEYANELKERTKPVEVKEVEEPPIEEYNEMDEAMLDFVIMCESSGRHDGIWGAEDEYGILQWKQETWDWLSEELNYEGDWKNRDDQIEFFLIAVENGYGRFWTCWRNYQKKQGNWLN